ncbi:MAG TPA: hypothetical protein VI007_13670 [bacterium]
MSARSRGHGRSAVLLFSMLIILLPATSVPAAAVALDVHATLGIGGWVSPGETTPLRVDIQSSTPLTGTLQVGVPSGARGEAVTTHLVPIRLAAGGRQQASVDVIVRDPRRPITLIVQDGSGERFRSALPVGPDRVVEGIIAALTREPAGLEFVTGTEGKRRPAYITEDDLPVRWQAFDAIDLLIIRDLDPRRVLPAQARALVDWVRQGGRLLIVAPRELNLAEAPWLRDLLQPNARGASGRGDVTVAGEDLFAPARRERGELRAQVRAVLDRARAPSVADPALADVLPSTRPLPGRTQIGLAVLSLLYIVAVRLVLRRFGAVRGGWVIMTVLVVLSTAGLYTVAAGARIAATSVAQLSVAEMLGTLEAARVTTYASIITPYGGRFAVSVPAGADARALSDTALTYDDGTREILGTAADGQLTVVVRQIVPLRLGVRRQASDLLVVDQGIPPLERVVLYRGRQVYRISTWAAGPIRLDPARWEPVDRPGALGTDTAGRGMDLLFRQLDRLGDTTWLVGRIVDERIGLKPRRGAGGEAVTLVVTEIR